MIVKVACVAVAVAIAGCGSSNALPPWAKLPQPSIDFDCADPPPIDVCTFIRGNDALVYAQVIGVDDVESPLVAATDSHEPVDNCDGGVIVPAKNIHFAARDVLHGDVDLRFTLHLGASSVWFEAAESLVPGTMVGLPMHWEEPGLWSISRENFFTEEGGELLFATRSCRDKPAFNGSAIEFREAARTCTDSDASRTRKQEYSIDGHPEETYAAVCWRPGTDD